MSFQTRKSFVCLWNTILDILDENREACDCPIEAKLLRVWNDMRVSD